MAQANQFWDKSAEKYSKQLIAPIDRFLGFFPFVAVFTTQALEDSLTNAGFELDYQWQPDKDKAVLRVAKKLG